MSKNTQRALYILLLGSLFGVAVYAYIFSKNPSTPTTYKTNMQILSYSFNAGDYGTALEKAKQMLSNAQTKEQEGVARLALGAGMWARNQPGDLANAARTFKEIAVDKTLPASTRSSALNYIATIVIANDATFYKATFPEPAYQSYAMTKQGAQDTHLAYFNLLMAAEAQQPNSFSENSLAGNWYAIELRRSGITKTEIADAKKNILHYLDLAENRDDTQNYTEVILVQMYLYRAVALESVAPEHTSIDSVENAYKKCLEAANNSSVHTNQLAESLAYKTRFRYAVFVTNHFPERHQDVVDLLSAFSKANTQNPYIIRYFTYMLSRAVTDTVTRDLLTTLSKDSPEFAAFLKKI